jgi:cytochrome c biogenesis protein CcmG, thiol:disulfide interchange protein DsbE
MRRLLFWAPLAVFAVFLWILALGLHKPSNPLIRSQLVGKPLPAFSLPAAVTGADAVTSKSYAEGKPRLVNIFASWCIPCAAEAPQLDALAKKGIPIDAIAIRDQPEDIAAFLKRWGNPYQRIALDKTSKVQIALGSSGVPETYVIDGKGVIRGQHIGEIMPDDVPNIVKAYEAAR